MSPLRGRPRALLGWGLAFTAGLGALAAAGLSHHPLFPWIDPVRTLSADWTRPWLVALPLAVALVPASLARVGWRHLPHKLLTALCLLPLVAYVLLPSHIHEHSLEPSVAGVPGVSAMVDGAPRQAQWQDDLAIITPWSGLARLVRSEATLAAVAHGIVASGEADLVVRGDLEPDAAERRGRVRGVLWAGYPALLAFYLLQHLLLLPLLPTIFATVFLKRTPPAWLRLLVWLPLVLLLLLPPVANLCFLVGSWALGLPEAARDSTGAWQVIGAVLGVAGLAFASAWLLVGRVPRVDGPRSGAMAAGMGALLVLSPGCEGPVGAGGPDLPFPTEGDGLHLAKPTADAVQPDIVLVLLNGVWRTTSSSANPEEALVEGIGREPSLRFRNAYAASPSAFPSAASLLTGHYPSSIPACGVPSTSRPDADLPWCVSVPSSRHAIPDVAALYGYRTALVRGSFPGAAAFDARFQQVEVVEETSLAGLAAAQDAADRWWGGVSDAPRLMVVAHTVVGREELAPPEGVHRPISGKRVVLLQPLRSGSNGPAMPEEHGEADEKVLEQIRGHVQSAGAMLGPWLERMLSGSERPTWVIVTSAAGFDVSAPAGWRPSFGANPIVQETTVHVPLLFFHSSGWTREEPVRHVVELIDLCPSLLALAGAQPPAGIFGEDLFDLPPGEDPEALAYMEHGDMLYLRRGRFLYGYRAMVHYTTVLDPQLTTSLLQADPDDKGFHLHDVAADPTQQRELKLESGGAPTETMRQLLIAARLAATGAEDGGLTQEQLWELRMTPREGYW